jgi:hypothetical protein
MTSLKGKAYRNSIKHTVRKIGMIAPLLQKILLCCKVPLRLKST